MRSARALIAAACSSKSSRSRLRSIFPFTFLGSSSSVSQREGSM